MSKPNVTVLQVAKNYTLWYDYIVTKSQKKGLSKYLIEDKIKDIDVENPKTTDEVTLLINNATIRTIILKSICSDIHKEIVGITSTYQIMEFIQGKYEGNRADTAYWITRLNSLSTTKECKIMEILNEMKRIFIAMKNNKIEMRADEQLKYLFNAIPESYVSKIMLDANDTFDTIYTKMEADLKRKSYIEGWVEEEEEEKEDPMEIDYIKKGFFKTNNKNQHDNFNKNYSKYQKHCDICDKKNHNTSECWFNLKNKNSKYTKLLNKQVSNSKNSKNNDYLNNNNKSKNKSYHKNNNYNLNRKGTYFIGKPSNQDINDIYNANIDYHDIKAMFFEEEHINNNNNNYKHVNSNKNLNKHVHNKKYIKSVCNINLFNKFDVSFKNKCNRSTWLYDSGAGEHLTNDKSLLINYKEEKTILKCANNSPCIFEEYGEFHLNINSHKIILKRVLYSKDVSRNMLSGVELAKIHIKAITDVTKDNNARLTLLDEHNNCIGTFHANNNNEILITAIYNQKTKENIYKYIFNVNKLNKESMLRWHRRFGHYYIENMDKYLDMHNIKDP